MNVKDGLSSVRSVVEDDPIAPCEQALLASYRSRQTEQFAHQCRLIYFEIAQLSYVPARYDKEVSWRLRMEIAEDDGTRGLRDKLGSKLAPDDTTETRRFWWLPDQGFVSMLPSQF